MNEEDRAVIDELTAEVREANVYLKKIAEILLTEKYIRDEQQSNSEVDK